MFTDEAEFRDQVRQLIELQASLVRYVAAMHVELLTIRGELVDIRAKVHDVPREIIAADVDRKVEALSRVVDQANVERMLADGYLRERPPGDPWWDRPAASAGET